MIAAVFIHSAFVRRKTKKKTKQKILPLLVGADLCLHHTCLHTVAGQACMVPDLMEPCYRGDMLLGGCVAAQGP